MPVTDLDMVALGYVEIRVVRIGTPLDSKDALKFDLELKMPVWKLAFAVAGCINVPDADCVELYLDSQKLDRNAKLKDLYIDEDDVLEYKVVSGRGLRRSGSESESESGSGSGSGSGNVWADLVEPEAESRRLEEYPEPPTDRIEAAGKEKWMERFPRSGDPEEKGVPFTLADPNRGDLKLFHFSPEHIDTADWLLHMMRPAENVVALFPSPN